ncbi:unnamed protein product [Medioppia subpectinata]|uniref:Uncharacterized protein n=1 Tax=Medioppia subpectinata TaxID=1979941 RepID=A0A7R9M0V1_9ACAR|nr:unnamed protein product [Medioppia subpectinata]CAG2122804.1 unnamed protein product [Medioppia subpectinata]
MVSKAGKLLLKNTIQSLEHQNKIKEEKLMWSKWQSDRQEDDGEVVVKNQRSDGHRDNGSHCSRSYDRKRVSDDRQYEGSAKRHKTKDTKPDNYWLKKLMTEEEKHSTDRWTHNGFKELYSEELASDESTSDSEKEAKKKHKKKRKHKHKKHKKKNK